jgi:hypothetical protein
LLAKRDGTAQNTDYHRRLRDKLLSVRRFNEFLLG